MSDFSRETSSTSVCARSRLFQKSGAAMRASSSPSCSCSFGTSKKPPQFRDSRFQIFRADFLNVRCHDAEDNDAPTTCQSPSQASAMRDLLRLGRGALLAAEDRLAFAHHIEPITGVHFQESRIVLKQIHFARLTREQCSLLRDLRLQTVDFAADLRELLVLRNKETDENQRAGETEQHTQNAVELLPD